MVELESKEGLKRQTSTVSKPLSHLKTDITLEHADLPIIACCLVSGLCDSSVYASWSCFVSMQTGNTIFLALGASNQPISHPFGWLKSMISIIFFCIGCITWAQTRRFGALHRGSLTISFLLQALCIFIAAALVQSHVVPNFNAASTEAMEPDVHFIELLPLAFLAFQSGGQMISSRLLGFNEVPTTVLTSVYCDFISDPKLTAPINANVKRNRRFAAIVVLLIGAIAGGWLAKSGPGMVVALWISGVIKLAIAITWYFWKGDDKLPA